jgi:phage recombination protein Bet
LEGRVGNGSEIVHAAAFAKMTAEQLELLKRTVCRGATDDELAMFLTVCAKHDADPFLKEVYAVKRWDKAMGREVMAIQCGIDFYRKRAADSGAYAGSDEPTFEEFPEDHQAYRKHPAKASVTVHRIVSGMRVAFSASARWSEYAQYKDGGVLTRFWDKMPYSQLAKCAEALALRKAFPREVAGLRTSDEMDQADNPPAAALLATETVPTIPDLSGRPADPPGPPADWLHPTAFKGNGNISADQAKVLADLCHKTAISGPDLKRFLEAASAGKKFDSVADVTRPGYAKLHGLLTAVTEGGKYFFPADKEGRFDANGVPSFIDVSPASTEEAKKSAAATKAIPF